MTVNPLPHPINSWFYGMTVLPASPAVIYTGTTLLTKALLANTTANPVTVTITDNSTEASGSPCQIVPAISIAANSVQIVDLGGVVANGGVQWSASSGSAVHGYLKGGY